MSAPGLDAPGADGPGADGYSEPAARGFSYAYRARLLHAETSPFQRIEVWESDAFGRMLSLDGLTQTTEADEFLYHEMLVHVPLLCLEDPRRVLVVGGGDGGTLRHVLMHPSVERAVMVEIDRRVVEVCREYLPALSAGAFDDPRAEVLFDDGAAYIAGTGEPFDAIIVDSSDPVGPGEILFGRDFYAAARRRVAPGGLLAAQSGSPFFQQAELHAAARNAATAFPAVRPYLGAVPTYPGTLWSFLLCGEAVAPDGTAAAGRANARGLPPRAWTPAMHESCFALPQFVLDVIGTADPPRPFGPSPEEHARHHLSGR